MLGRPPPPPPTRKKGRGSNCSFSFSVPSSGLVFSPGALEHMKPEKGEETWKGVSFLEERRRRASILGALHFAKDM